MKRANLILSVLVLTTLIMTSCGDSYTEVKIGDQVWMAENLSIPKFRNGDPIPHAKTDEEWEKAGNDGMPAWCYYDNNPENERIYGKLYNWYAINDPRGLAPKGWRVPSDADWTLLTNSMGGVNIAGTKLKAKNGWSSNGNGTDIYNFSALPGGGRDYDGTFYLVGSNGYWWSATEGGANNAWYRGMRYDLSNVYRGLNGRELGFSVRCVRDL